MIKGRLSEINNSLKINIVLSGFHLHVRITRRGGTVNGYCNYFENLIKCFVAPRRTRKSNIRELFGNVFNNSFVVGIVNALKQTFYN